MKNVATERSGTDAEVSPGASSPGRKRRFGARARRTRLKGLGAPAPYPVRGLWAAATEEERTKAKTTATALLEYWTARRSKAETAAELRVTPVRVWQLSQQALFGMLAGLLKQPRTRGRIPRAAIEGTRGSTTERAAESTRLKKELERARRLIEVLKEMPGAGAAAPARPPAAPKGTAKKGAESTTSRRSSVPAKRRHAPNVPPPGRANDGGADPRGAARDGAADGRDDRGVRGGGGPV